MTPYLTSIKTDLAPKGGVELVLWDTGGSANLRDLLKAPPIGNIDCVVVCYSVIERHRTVDIPSVISPSTWAISQECLNANLRVSGSQLLNLLCLGSQSFLQDSRPTCALIGKTLS